MFTRLQKNFCREAMGGGLLVRENVQYKCDLVCVVVTCHCGNRFINIYSSLDSYDMMKGI